MEKGDKAMGLRFIYGTAGTGKSEFCFNEIKNNIKNKEKIYIITPEQFSYSAEKKLLEEINTNASVNAEVISFNRIANRVFTEVGGANEVLISKSSKAMLIYSILEKEKKNLKFLNSSDDNIDIILKEITEFKKHNITTKTLKVIVKLRISAITLNKPREVFTSKRKHTKKNRQLVKMTLSTRIWNTTITYNHIPIPIRTTKKKDTGKCTCPPKKALILTLKAGFTNSY